MATTAERRAWLADNGHPELRDGKGRIPAGLAAEYDAAHPPADDYGPGTSPDDFAGDLPFVSAEDPPPDPGDVGWAEDAGAAAAEERPSRPHAARARFGFRRHTARTARPKKAKAGGKAFRRISVAPLIEDAYSDLAWAAAGIPPLQRLLNAQAPIAGVVLDPVVQGTVADRVLQPAARNYERMKVGTALLGTPAALMAVLATAPGPVIGEDGRPVLIPVLGPDGQPNGRTTLAMAPATLEHKTALVGLRMCVRAMADVAGGDALQRVQERAEENIRRDDQVNEFIGYLLGVPVPEDADQTAAREARDAGLRLAGVVQ